ncbi:hypothetical protein [Allomuricauda sp. NBRC 101325]|uniref:hypothetical protein n=1 Tax=Allomuricauda sp. NBRC 101325 TaxID=1113758 RepID=UPI002554D837|nr:hypothetical protein [Muricauda sp. NBRC 101325]
MKNLKVVIIISSIISFPSFVNRKNELVNTIWTSEGKYGIPGDSLKFRNDNQVAYYLGELGWEFDSIYTISGDTLTVKTKTLSMEIDNSNIDLVQKFLITTDSLKPFYLANKRGEKWLEAKKDRIEVMSSLYEIK